MDPTPDDPSSWPRLFTVDEANRLLPDLIPVLTELKAKKAALDEARIALARLTPTMRSNGHAAEAAVQERRLRDLTVALATGVRRITAQGVEIKDLDHGLIDFPSLRGNRVVYLCWRLGEGSIAYWHEIDAGFAGPRPL